MVDLNVVDIASTFGFFSEIAEMKGGLLKKNLVDKYEEKIFWVGECVKETNTRVFYNACAMREGCEVFTIGEDVELMHGEGDAYVAKIMNMWENKRGGRRGITAWWYYKCQDLPRQLLQKHAAHLRKYDIFLSMDSDDNDLFTIQGKANVQRSFVDVPDMDKGEYRCRYKYNSEKGKLENFSEREFAEMEKKYKRCAAKAMKDLESVRPRSNDDEMEDDDEDEDDAQEFQDDGSEQNSVDGAQEEVKRKDGEDKRTSTNRKEKHRKIKRKKSDNDKDITTNSKSSKNPTFSNTSTLSSIPSTDENVNWKRKRRDILQLRDYGDVRTVQEVYEFLCCTQRLSTLQTNMTAYIKEPKSGSLVYCRIIGRLPGPESYTVAEFPPKDPNEKVEHVVDLGQVFGVYHCCWALHTLRKVRKVDLASKSFAKDDTLLANIWKQFKGDACPIEKVMDQPVAIELFKDVRDRYELLQAFNDLIYEVSSFHSSREIRTFPNSLDVDDESFLSSMKLMLSKKEYQKILSYLSGHYSERYKTQELYQKVMPILKGKSPLDHLFLRFLPRKITSTANEK